MRVIELLRTFLIWIANGGLVIVFTLIDHALLLTCIPPILWLAYTAPPEQRRRVTAGGALSILAIALLPPPVPFIVVAMIWLGAIAVRAENFNRETLRARVTAGIALYALAALAATVVSAYLSTLDDGSWAGLLSFGSAADTAAKGRDYLSTIAAIGLWVVMPLGYFSLLAQAMLVHPPSKASPSAILGQARTRGRSDE